MRPLHRATDRPVTGTPRYVDAARGRDDHDGSPSRPWRTIAHALTQVRSGDTLLLRQGVYYENVYLARCGRPDARIIIRSHPGEVAVIDGGGCPEFVESPQTAWEPVQCEAPDVFRSTATYLNRRYVFAWFAQSMVGLLHYYHREDFGETQRTTIQNFPNEPFPAPVYLGPGVWYDTQTGHLWCRLTHTHYPFEAPGYINYTGERDARRIPMAVSFYGSLPLYLDGAEHVTLQDLVIRGAGEDAIRMRGCRHVTFDNVTVYCGTYGLHGRSSSQVRILNSGFYGSNPPWQVHAGQALRVSDPSLALPSGKPVLRDICRLNTHVLLAIEGRTEEQVDYYVPGNREWELAYSDFTDSADGIHLGGMGVDFHHNRVDRLMDDAVYLTPLTPRVLANARVHHNLFTRCLMSFGFGGFSDPASGPIYLYRNIVDQRADHYWAHCRPARLNIFCTHFPTTPRLGELYIYQNTIITQMNPTLSRACPSDVDRTYGQATLMWTQPDVPRRLFNNLFVYPHGMIPPLPETLPSPEEDVQIDGNVHHDMQQPQRSVQKLDQFRRSPLFEASRVRYEPGWEAHARVGDPQFAAFEVDGWAANDYRISPGGAAAGAGVPIPDAWPDEDRADQPDAGALRAGEPMFQTGRLRTAQDLILYAWLERPARENSR
jgi:hypothetical protein